MSYYVYSKLTGGQNYTQYVPVKAGDREPLAKKLRTIVIKGGANVARGRSPEIITPLGVRTEISDEEYEILKENTVFQIHLKNNHITVEKAKVNADKVAKDLANDVSRPRTPEDFKDPEGVKPEGSKKK